METEQWRTIPGFTTKYEVSDMGRVRSPGRWLQEPRIKTLSLNPNGYLYVGLSRNNTNVGGPVHRYVAAAFVDNPDSLPEVNHKDGNKRNNAASNLEWVTRSQNAQHAVDMGKMPSGERHKWAKITADDVMQIRYMHCVLGHSQNYLARLFGIGSVQKIVEGKSWRAA